MTMRPKRPLSWTDVKQPWWQSSAAHNESRVFAVASDGARLVRHTFFEFRGVKLKVVKYYAHGPRGVVDWIDSPEECKAAYEKLGGVA